jgi:hypothetical protein
MLFLRTIGKILRFAAKLLLTKKNKMRIKILLSFLLAIISTMTFAQQRAISGSVQDDAGIPLLEQLYLSKILIEVLQQTLMVTFLSKLQPAKCLL